MEKKINFDKNNQLNNSKHEKNKNSFNSKNKSKFPEKNDTKKINKYNLKTEEINIIKNLVQNTYFRNDYFNTFCVFKSIDEVFYLIFTDLEGSIISYNLVDNKKINEIRDENNELIKCIRHYLDEANKRDLILSITEKYIKLWNLNICECLGKYNNEIMLGYVRACFLNYRNNIYICRFKSEPYPYDIKLIQILNLNGNVEAEINKYIENVCFIDSYYDKNLLKSYIIICNINYTISYDYNYNKKYHKYDDKQMGHYNIIFNDDKKGVIKMFESCEDGILRIWDFHSAELLSKINISNYRLYGLCLLNNKLLLVGCEDKTMKLIEIKKGTVINSWNISIIALKKINHPIYGQVIVSQGGNGDINLWKKGI